MGLSTKEEIPLFFMYFFFFSSICSRSFGPGCRGGGGLSTKKNNFFAASLSDSTLKA